MKKKQKIKRLTALILAGIMVLSMAACGEKNTEEKLPYNPEDAYVKPEDLGPELKLTAEELPIIDGATAMLPYYEEMTSRLLDIPIEEARKLVMCTTTPFAYDNLANGKADLIFCAPPSDEQVADAKAKGVEYELAQVLNSGFVFFVNKSNPIDSISSKALHDIYAGKITNWKELGGDDEPIIAYQRSEGSGSQTGLYQHLIPKEEVMEPPMEQQIAEMGAIIDAVAHYDNAKGAIGYSYYYYITNMHYEEDVKLLAIDNIYPTPETISTDLYPFISKTAAVFNSNEPEDSVVRKIVEWCTGKRGMKMAQDLGYVPSDSDGFVIPGYGDDFKFGKAPDYVTENNITIQTVLENPQVNEATGYSWSDYQYLTVSGLKDKTVEKKINDTIKEIYDRYVYEGYVPEYRKVSTVVPDAEKYDVQVSMYSYANFNNILSLNMSIYMNDQSGEPYSYLYPIETFNFDLRTGKQLKLADILIDGKESFKYIDSLIYKKLSDGNYDDEGQFEVYDDFKLAAPFTGIREDQKFLIDDMGYITLVFDNNTPEFYISNHWCGFNVDGKNIMDFNCCSSEKSLFENETPVYRFFAKYYHSDDEVIQLTDMDTGRKVQEVIGSRNISFWGEEIINKEMPASIAAFARLDESLLFEEAQYMADKYDELEAQGNSLYGSMYAYSTYHFVGRYITGSNYYNRSLYYGPSGSYQSERDEKYVSFSKLFDAESGEELELSDLFVPGSDYVGIIEDGFRRYNKAELGDEYNEELFNGYLENAMDGITGFGLGNDSLTFTYYNPDSYDMPNTKWLSLPFKYIGCENMVIFD